MTESLEYGVIVAGKDMEKQVYFYSGPALKLAGSLKIPDDYSHSGAKLPGIVLCQGPVTGKDTNVLENDRLMIQVSECLGKVGYVTMRFCYRGVGESEGPQYRLIPMEQVEDIENAVTFLQHQADVDASRIGLLGTATGGAHASYVAGTDHRIKCIVSVNGMGDLGRWMQQIRRYWEWVEFAKILDEDRIARVLTGQSRVIEIREVIVHDPHTAQLAADAEKRGLISGKRLISIESAEAISFYRPETVVDRISPRAAMWICALGDNLVPNEQSQSMYEKAGEPKRLVVLDGVSHHGLYEGAGFERMMTVATEWFDTHLR